MKTIRFLPEAETEFLDEVAYYANIRRALGEQFRQAVQSALARVAIHPLGGAPSFHETRSVLIRGFPFSLVYRSSDGVLLVVAVAHHRRRPGYWLARADA
jgi:toxin ParE1/3/4